MKKPFLFFSVVFGLLLFGFGVVQYNNLSDEDKMFAMPGVSVAMGLFVLLVGTLTSDKVDKNVDKKPTIEESKESDDATG